MQRACATRAVKASALLQVRVKKVMTEKDRLTARCDELPFEKNCVRGLVKKGKKAHDLCVEIHSLKEERSRSAIPSLSLHGKKLLTDLEASVPEAPKS